jgi:TolB-like protein
MSRNPGYQRFFAELKRRRVFRVAAVYGGSAFVVLQVADVVAEGLNLSPGVLQAVTLLILAGFPIALALAWAFQVTPEGVRRTDPATPADLDAIVAQPRGQRWPAGVLGLLGGIAIATAGWWALGPRPAAEDDSARESAAEVADPADVYLASLAVLPFANRSDNPENEYFTDGVHDDILTELSRLEGLKLISRMIDADTDAHLWAETYDQELTAANVFAIQSDVAREIASALEATLVAGEPAEGRPPPTESLEAYDRLTELQLRPGLHGTRRSAPDPVLLGPVHAGGDQAGRRVRLGPGAGARSAARRSAHRTGAISAEPGPI